MAVDTSPVTNNKQTKPGRRSAQAPPEGAFWRKYSPHHEFPLSLSSSVFLHVLGFVLLGGFLLAFFGLNRDKELPMNVVVIQPGGGGHLEGIGNNAGSGVLPSKEAVEDKDKPQADRVAENVNKAELAKPEAQKPELPPLPSTGDRAIEDNSAASTKLGAIGDKLRERIRGAIAGEGLGGSGRGGGKGSGTGPGEGSGVGPGRGGNLTQREKRQQRWTMMFSTRSGEDYIDQLIGLGAILAIPGPGPDGEYLVIRDLRRRPVHAVPEDLNKLNRIWWADHKPQSVYSLARALGIHPVPEHIVAFFPQQLEQELAEKERSYASKNEDEIEETVFRVERHGGRYEPVVQSQRRR